MFQHPGSFKIGGKNFHREKLLGSGAFGTVFCVRDKSGKAFAVKDIPALSKDCLEAIQSEISLLMRVDHENVVKLTDFDTYEWEDILHVCLLLEYCGGGTLNGVLTGERNEFMNSIWMTQLGSALAYLHDQSVIHRDLKPDNVLLDEYNCIKLVDFGLARLLFIQCADQDSDNWVATYIEHYQKTLVGTPHWMAPEVFHNHYTEKADIFSLGVLFYAIAERNYITSGNKRYYGAFLPYNNVRYGIGNILAKYGPVVDVHFSLTGASRGIRELIIDMLEYDPHERPNANEVKERITNISKNFSRFSLVSQSSGIEKRRHSSGVCCT